MGKIVITGTGRCGTSFLMHLFTALGFNTGYTLVECVWHLKRSKCDGGIEHSIGTERFDKADIVKNPEWFYKPELLDFDIDYIVLPFRKLENVALSRARNNGYGGFHQGANDPDSQIKLDSKALYKFLEYTVGKDLKIIHLDFPRIVKDVDYLFIKLIECRLCTLDSFKRLKKAFNEIADSEKVHI